MDSTVTRTKGLVRMAAALLLLCTAIVSARSAQAFCEAVDGYSTCPDMTVAMESAPPCDAMKLGSRDLRSNRLPPTERYAAAIRCPSADPRVYVIVGGAKLWVHDQAQLSSYYGGWGAVRVLPYGSLTGVSTVPRDGTLIYGWGSPEVYVMNNGKRRWIPDPTTFECNHYDWGRIRYLGPMEMADIARGPDMPVQLIAEQYTDLGANHHMWTDVFCWDSGSGTLTGTTRIATFTLFGGFHGAVVVVLADAQGRTIGRTEPQRFWVNGAAFGNSDQTFEWTTAVVEDPAKAALVRSISIVHFWAPDPDTMGTVKDIVDRSIDIVEPVVDLVKKVCDLGVCG
jgi:hypothetical protein